VRKSASIENGSAMTKAERIPLAALLETAGGRKNFERIALAAMKGAVLIYPTETVYGLGGVYGADGVKERIFSIKRRSTGRPLICIAPERSCFSVLPVAFPHAAERLAHMFWPGKLTLILPSTLESRGIGVRVSRHPFITEIFRYVESPLYSTSANISGEPYVNDPEAIYDVFSGRVDFFVDAGPLRHSRSSTVVSVGADGTVRIVREGAIPAGDIFNSLSREGEGCTPECRGTS
jgi:L-threonylcarbamoyladenylate synthase